MIHRTAIVDPDAQIDSDVEIGPYVLIEGPVRILSGTQIQGHAVISGAVSIGRNNRIGFGSIIGAFPQDLSYNPAARSGVEIGDNNVLREYCTIHRGTKEGTNTRVGSNNLLMVGSHLGHNTWLGTGLNKDAEAVAGYKRVLALKPDLYEAKLNLGMVLLRDHDAQSALPFLQQAAQQKPKEARPNRYLGDALLQTGDATGAAQAYQAALAQDPKMAAAELGLGQSLLQQGKLDEALPHYQQAAALDPALKSYLLEIAGAFSKAKRNADAIPLLKEFPNDPGACEELGRIYLSEHQPGDAVPAFKAAVDISPTPANQLSLATAYLENSQPDLAAPILERALASDPKDYDLRMAVGRIYRDKRQFVPAANQFVAAAQIRPESVEAWNEAASVFVMAEQYPQALAALDKVRALNAENPGDVYYRALIYDKLRQIKPALENYQRFLSVSGGKYPDQEFIARQRSRILEKEANR